MLSIVVSIVTMVGMWLAGRKRWEAWALGLANQVLWAWLIIVSRQWGLFLLTGALVYIYTTNLIRWRRDDRMAAAEADADPNSVVYKLYIPKELSFPEGEDSFTDELIAFMHQRLDPRPERPPVPTHPTHPPVEPPMPGEPTMDLLEPESRSVSDWMRYRFGNGR